MRRLRVGCASPVLACMVSGGWLARMPAHGGVTPRNMVVIYPG